VHVETAKDGIYILLVIDGYSTLGLIVNELKTHDPTGIFLLHCKDLVCSWLHASLRPALVLPKLSTLSTWIARMVTSLLVERRTYTVLSEYAQW
jgi:hypothetical protein